MTNEKKTVKKTLPKKVAPKKTEDVSKTAEDVVETPVEKAVPKRKKRVEIDRNEMIPCRSATHGRLIYISNRTRSKFVWEGFGSTLWLEMSELLDMNGSQRNYLHNGHIVVDDEEASEYLGLSGIYNEMYQIEDLDKFLKKDTNTLLEVIPKLPKGAKKSLSTKARELIENGKLDSIGKIRALESALGVDLEDFIKAK